MSDKEAEAAEICCCCANCAVAEVDDIKLDTCCDGCDLVKYCRDKCMEEHREQHDEDCKKRKVELHDKQLFTQPPGTHQGECTTMKEIGILQLNSGQKQLNWETQKRIISCQRCIVGGKVSRRTRKRKFII
jgi:hypothetical protein